MNAGRGMKQRNKNSLLDPTFTMFMNINPMPPGIWFNNKPKQSPGKWKEKKKKTRTLPERRRGYDPETEANANRKSKQKWEGMKVLLLFFGLSFGFYWVGEIIGDGKWRRRSKTDRTSETTSWNFLKFLLFLSFLFCSFIHSCWACLSHN